MGLTGGVTPELMEKLVDFGIKPFRGLKRARKAVEKKAAVPETSGE
jgi:hypothetical protein